MPLYRGSQKIEDLYIGSTKIGELYKGSTLVYKSCKYNPDQVIFESTTPGTYSLDLLETGKYEVYCIGGGAGGVVNYITGPGGSRYSPTGGGGSGGGFIGIVQLSNNTYSIVVGGGGAGAVLTDYGNAGSNSSIGNIITAYAGLGGQARIITGVGGAGGGAPSINTTIISQTLNRGGNAGTGGNDDDGYGGASIYNGYGAGGTNYNNGTAGYIKIIFKGKH